MSKKDTYLGGSSIIKPDNWGEYVKIKNNRMMKRQKKISEEKSQLRKEIESFVSIPYIIKGNQKNA